MNNTMFLFLKGLVIGFSISAPVGPIGIFCIQLTLTDGILVGITAGLGAALACACYGAIAGFGLTSISSFLLAQKTTLSLFGVIFLAYLGITTITTKPITESSDVKPKGLLNTFLSMFALTASNPMTILLFMTIFTGLGMFENKNSTSEAIALILGVFIGSILWWLILSGSVGLLRKKVTPTTLRWINIVSGIIILIFAIGILYQLK